MCIRDSIRTVHGVAGRAPRFVLIDAVKDGRPGLHWLEPLNLLSLIHI